nr:cytochrome c [uncultured Brumimicrobium sp.]
MKNYFKLGLLVLAVSLYSCGGGEAETETKKEESALVNPNNPNNPNNSVADEPAEEEATDEVLPSQRIDLVSIGVGPVKSVTIDEAIDEEMAAKGKTLYDQKCTACHKPDERFVGPPQKDILERRTPEWVLNMIINPDVMVKEDPLAKALFEEYKGAAMTNYNLSEEDARAILEYIRTF